MVTEARDAEIREAFREAFEKLENVRDCLLRLRDVMIIKEDEE